MNLQEKYGLSKSAYDIAEICNVFATKMTANSIHPRDYGTGEMYTSVETHIVTSVHLYPGITAKEIASSTARTQSAVSQVVNKLIKKELIYSKKHPEDKRKTCLYTTEKGEELANAHIKYDEAAMEFVLKTMMDKLGVGALENFIEILSFMTFQREW